jgi:type IV pilus assembly protein PilB
MAERLGELLVRKNLITPEQLQGALREQKASGTRLGTALTKLGLVDEGELTTVLSEQYGIPSVNLDEVEIPGDVIELVPEGVATKYQIVPVNRAGSTLMIAAADPTNVETIDAIRFKTDLDVEVVIASEGAIKRAINRYYDSSSTLQEVMAKMDEEVDLVEDEEEISISELEKATEDAPVIKLVNSILTDAIKKKASDIHVEPFEDEFRVRFRIDGVLYEVTKLPLKFKNAVTSRLKIMSKLDIAERRLPQDGRIKLKLSKGEEMDFRVSVLPSLFGEKVVMRLLDKSNLQLDMTKLGFEEMALEDFKRSIHQPFGMVLVTGPTGSGKTTTLYSALSELNKISENISTAEDPVEFNLKGITQVHMNEDIGLNFAAALRSFLRQDPDIIMVGEIRDFETAEIAVKAALTGHMVLSTLHTNDAPSTINRLLNMGVEPFLVSSSLNCIVAQRLARRVCSNCQEEVKVPVQALIDLGFDEGEAQSVSCYQGRGCNICHDTGFKGRIALYEVMVVGDEIKEFILNGASAAELKREAIRLGMKTLRQSGLTKLKEGITTVEEVIRTSVAD